MLAINFNTSINEFSIQKLKQAVKNREEEEIHLIISSSGGKNNAARDGFYYFSRLKNLTIYGKDKVDSSAVVLFCSSPKRICLPNTTFLFHAATIDLNASMPKIMNIQQLNFNINLLKQRINTIKNDETIIAHIVGQTTKNHPKKIMRLMHHNQTGIKITSTIAKSLNIVNDIISTLPDFPDILNIE